MFESALSKTALSFSAAAVAVAAVVVQPKPFESQSLADAGLACPAGMVLESEALRREAHAMTGSASVAAAAAKTGNPICVRALKPESFAEFTRASAARAEAMGGSTPGTLRRAVEQKASMAPLQAKVSSADSAWVPYGTGPMIGNDARFPEVSGQGFTNLAGRADQFTYDAASKRLFVAIGNGGIWMSQAVNGDVRTLADNWASVGDKLPMQITSGIGYSPNGGANGTLIALTGEHTQGGNSYVGLGAYWSADLGATWTRATGVPDEAQGFAVAVDPGNPNIVYAATGKGLYRSTDTGKSFVNVALPTSALCTGVDGLAKRVGTTPEGMGECLLASIVTDVRVRAPGGSTNIANDPAGNPVVAAVGYRAGQLPYMDGKMQAPGNGVYKSATGAAGSFTKLAVSGDGSTGRGFAPQERIGRIELGEAKGAAQNHNYLYAIVEDSVLFNGGLAIPLGLPVEDVTGPTLGAVDCSDLPAGDPQFVCNTVKGGATFGATTINGVYVSANFGDSWTRMADTTEIALLPTTGSGLYVASALGVGPGVQAWYDMWIAPDPTRTSASPLAPGAPGRLAFGIEEVWANVAQAANLPQDGVAQQAPAVAKGDFEVVGVYFAGDRCQLLIGSATPGVPVCPTDTTPVPTNGRKTTHPDQQTGFFIPTTGTDGMPDGGVCLFAGHDGGVNRACLTSTGSIDSNTWADPENDGFHTLFHYGFAVAKDGTVWFGNQDNGSGKIVPGATPGTAGNTFQTYVGDGVYALVDPDDADIAYVETPGLAMNVTTDGGTTYTNIAPDGVTDAYFGSIFIMDPTDKKHIITGGRQVFETTLGEATRGDTWVQVFDLGRGPGDSVRNIRAADTHGNFSYVGFCGPCSILGRPDLGFDRGIATNVGGTAPPMKASPDGWRFAAANGLPNRYINWLEIDPADPTGKTVYASLGGYTLAHWLPAGMYLDRNTAAAKIGQGNVWKSSDGGENFVSVSGNLPDSRAMTVYKLGEQILVGTEIGPFISDDADGTTWAPLGTGMPNVVVTQFQTLPGDDKTLFASTFGRGMWKTTLVDAAVGGSSSSSSSSGGTSSGSVSSSSSSSGGSSSGSVSSSGSSGGAILPGDVGNPVTTTTSTNTAGRFGGGALGGGTLLVLAGLLALGRRRRGASVF